MKPAALSLVLALLLCAVPVTDAAAQTSATLVNNSSYDIHELYLSASDDEYWGPDQLGKSILANGDALTLHGMPCGDYDVKLVDEVGDVCVVERQRLCGDAGEWYLTDEDLLDCQGFKVATASATLTNGTRWDIYHLYLSASHEEYWGPDQLGRQILQRGDSVTLSGLACGDYDLKLVDEDGDECEVYEIYLCGAEGEAVLTEKELLDCQGW